MRRKMYFGHISMMSPVSTCLRSTAGSATLPASGGCWQRMPVMWPRQPRSGRSPQMRWADRPEGESVHPTTTSDYLTVLERVMVVEEQKSWGPHLRSRDVVRKASIRHFVDPSLAVAAMGGSPDRLLGDPRAFGLLFESLVIRDLRVYTQPFDGEVLHYRDAAGAEADAIIQLRDGRWAAIEVKLGESRVEEAVTSLERLVAKIDTARAGEPVARIVITGGRYAYTRPDGVHVVPLGCLAP
ncbi:ATP-binding protein [Microbacterium lacticum]